uniref:Uncharacterized protein n=1 Tax=Glossina pallidipes TaxID=7398 RepID=A0A1A9ZXF4_GLOPL
MKLEYKHKLRLIYEMLSFKGKKKRSFSTNYQYLGEDIFYWYLKRRINVHEYNMMRIVEVRKDMERFIKYPDLTKNRKIMFPFNSRAFSALYEKRRDLAIVTLEKEVKIFCTSMPSLFASALSVCPSNAKIHYNIARLAQSDAKNYSKAFYHYYEAIKIYPRYEAALHNEDGDNGTRLSKNV